MSLVFTAMMLVSLIDTYLLTKCPLSENNHFSSAFKGIFKYSENWYFTVFCYVCSKATFWSILFILGYWLFNESNFIVFFITWVIASISNVIHFYKHHTLYELQYYSGKKIKDIY